MIRDKQILEYSRGDTNDKDNNNNNKDKDKDNNNTSLPKRSPISVTNSWWDNLFRKPAVVRDPDDPNRYFNVLHIAAMYNQLSWVKMIHLHREEV